MRPYLGESAEERIKARRRRLLDAAFQLLASVGWRRVTIESLCRKAKLNKRYFYESFGDLDELAAAVVDELAAELAIAGFETARAGRKAGLTTDDLASRAIAAVVGYLTDDPRRARVLFTEVADSPRAVAHRKTAIQGLARELSAYAYEHHNTDGADPISELASAVLIGGTIEAILSWLGGNIDMPREQLIADLAALWVFAGDGAAARAKARKSASKDDEPVG